MLESHFHNIEFQINFTVSLNTKLIWECICNQKQMGS